MLKRRRRSATLWALAVGLLPGLAWAQDDKRAGELIRPERLTVDVADDLLGQLSQDGKTLYFVSTVNTTSQLFAENLEDGRTRQLFDDGADITWPRVSPDGKSLLYVSFREDASGRLCIRNLPDASGRRCFQDSAAALQAEWIDSNRIALVARKSLHGDLQIVEVTTKPRISSRSLLEKNATSPSVSRDGRWMVYVPISRTVENVGPAFAAQAAPQLEAVKLGSNAPPIRLTLELPGQTGQPAFARDGKSLYIVQFFADTNHDGAIDANDHGVLFRVPLSFEGDTPKVGAPEQLTETSWNCQYPAPFPDRLIATCSLEASLDVYSMPLDGEVPKDWSDEALKTALENASTRVEQQLIVSRILSRQTTVGGKRRAMMALSLAHLEREEFRAAEYYAELLHTLRDETTAGISLPLQLLVEQRRSARKREQGRMIEGFAEEAKKRLAKLKPEVIESPMAEDLLHLVRSEVADSIGDKTLARTELEAVTIDETTPGPIVEAYYQHADALYRELDDREALITACRQLAKNPALLPDEQLRYARAAVRAMVRGLPYNDATARILRERAGVSKAEGELAFAIDLGAAVLAIRDSHPPQNVADTLLALHAAQTRAGRRRALIGDAVRRADDVDADELLDALAQKDIEDVKKGTHERVAAEGLYRRMMVGRAYERAAAKRYADARSDFDAVFRETGSYEALVGSLDMRLLSGESTESLVAFYAKGGIAPSTAHFATAYLLARRLDDLEGEPRARAAQEALRALQASWPELKGQRMAHALFGALLHEEFLQTEDRSTAETANFHYLIALELVGKNPRFRAMILSELGLLHTDVENYRIALSYLEERDKLPYSDNTAGLDVLVSKAQALLHIGRDKEAASAGDMAIAMVDRTPDLSPHLLLALDWAALANLSAGRFERALEIYARELPLLDRAKSPFAERNRMVARVARAAATIGAGKGALALPDLDYLEAHLGDSAVAETLRWPHAEASDVVRTYRLIVAGLRAAAYRELGNFTAEAAALEERLATLAKNFDKAPSESIVRDQMLAETQLATNASRRHDPARAALWLGRALARADDIHARLHGTTGKDQLDVLWLAAELTLSMKTTLVPDLPKRIDAACKDMVSRRDPTFRSYLRRFEIYGTLLPGTVQPPVATK